MASNALSGFIEKSTIALNLFPGVLAGVKAIQDHAAAVHAASGVELTGPQKKDLLMTTITSSIDVAAQVGQQIPNPWIATVSALVDVAVKMLWAGGIFKSPVPVAASASPAA